MSGSPETLPFHSEGQKSVNQLRKNISFLVRIFEIDDDEHLTPVNDVKFDGK